MTTVKLNNFARRQDSASEYAHFQGSEGELCSLAEAYLEAALGTPDGAKGILKVPVPAEGFFSSIVPRRDDQEIVTEMVARREGEEPVEKVTTVGHKVPARYVELILYSGETLDAEGARSTDADYEIVSINASPTAEPTPEHPESMRRNAEGKAGGTPRTYTPEEWEASEKFWGSHVQVRPPQ